MQRRRQAAAMALLIALPLLAVADVVTAVVLPRHSAGRSIPVATPPTTTTGASVAPTTVPTSGPTTTPTTGAPVASAVISGTVTAAHLVGATGSPLPMPITITIPNRGQGALNIDGVVIRGHPGATVAWDGGQPLPISGAGDLELGPATMDASPAGITWHLDGLPRYFGAGTYMANSSVAVGTGGLALALDQIGFSVPPGGRGQLESDGDAQVHLTPRTVTVTGPGTVQLLGSLTVTTPGGTRTAHNLHAGSGPFSLTLTPGTGGFTVHGVIQGPLAFP